MSKKKARGYGTGKVQTFLRYFFIAMFAVLVGFSVAALACSLRSQVQGVSQTK